MNLWRIYGIIVVLFLSMVLSSCGGEGGSSSPDTTPDTPPDTPPVNSLVCNMPISDFLRATGPEPLFQSYLATEMEWVGDMVSGDLDGDGKLDLVTLSHLPTSIHVMLGAGGGSFYPAFDCPMENDPTSLDISDLNGDDILDLVVTFENYSPDSDGGVSVYLGNGDGNFKTSHKFLAGKGINDTAIGDLNGDGLLDLAVTHRNGVSVLLGYGDGGVGPEDNFTAVPRPGSIAIGDLNGDGIPDLVVTYEAEYNEWLMAGKMGVAILYGKGDGSFGAAKRELDMPGARSLALGDLNSDGFLDMVVSMNEGLAVMLGDGSGVFRDEDDTLGSATVYSQESASVHLAIADLNGDNDLDLVRIANTFKDSRVLLGDGEGRFQEAGMCSIGGLVSVGDFDGDGNPDLVIKKSGRNNVEVFLGDGTGNFPNPLSFIAGTSSHINDPLAVATDDLNGDGVIDLVVTHYGADVDDSEVSVLLGDGAGNFAIIGDYIIGRKPNSVAISDLNKDGFLDLTLSYIGPPSVGGGLFVLMGKGDGSFMRAVNYPMEEHPLFVASGDLNGDGFVDLVLTHWDDYGSGESVDGGISVLMGKGDGSFLDSVNYFAGIRPSSAVISDVNGDDFLDISVTNKDSDSISVLIGDGVGRFSEATNYATGVNPVFVDAADLNGDSIIDLTVANKGSDDVSVLLGNGDGGFMTAVNYPVGKSPVSVTIGNLNGAGGLDLIVANFDSSSVSVLLGDGAGDFVRERDYGTNGSSYTMVLGDRNNDRFHDVALNGSPHSMVSGDMNNDGYLDVAVTQIHNNTSVTRVTVLLGSGTNASPLSARPLPRPQHHPLNNPNNQEPPWSVNSN